MTKMTKMMKMKRKTEKTVVAVTALLLALLMLGMTGCKRKPGITAGPTAPTSGEVPTTSEGGETAPSTEAPDTKTPDVPETSVNPTTDTSVIPTTDTPVVPTTDTPVAPTETPATTTPVVTETPTPVKPTAVVIDQKEIEVAVGGSAKVTAHLMPIGAEARKIEWISENKAAFSVDKEGNVLGIAEGKGYITAYVYDGTDAGLTCIVPVTVLPAGTVVTPTPTETPVVTPTETPTVTPTETPAKPSYVHYDYDFKADLSAYEKYMDPTTDEYLILVNADHPLDRSYVPDDLVDAVNTRKDGRDLAQLRLYAEKAMEALFLEAEANGMLYENSMEDENGQVYKRVLSITTAYRSYGTQEWLYDSYVERDAALYPHLTLEEVKKLVSTYSCPPGTSEHQTGLCVDMHNWPTAGRYMAKDFAASAAGRWLRENSYKFGYILRFDEDKTDITGITYESWHFRYVGRYHATQMHELGLCLEEYIDYLNALGYEFT